MCYYNGIRVTKTEHVKLLGIEKELKNLRLNRPVQSGFLFRSWPILKANAEKTDFDLVDVHWEYVPDFVFDELQLQESRKMQTWLNAKSENLFVNDNGKQSMWRKGAMNGRCIVLSSGFFEWRHIPKIGKKGRALKATEAIPYHITLKEKPNEVFYMAGIMNHWTNEKKNQSADTFAIVTTEANELMASIHNKKKRMPTILPEELAKEWLLGNLDQTEIMEIGGHQVDVDEMIAWPIAKDFESKTNPEEEFHYEKLPPLWETTSPTLFS